MTAAEAAVAPIVARASSEPLHEEDVSAADADDEFSTAARQLRDHGDALRRQLIEIRSGSAQLHESTRLLRLRSEAVKRNVESIRAGVQLAALAGEGTRRDRSGVREVDRGELSKRFGALSPRQREVLIAVIGGKANKAIAFELGVSQKTVETHRARVMDKLGVTSLAELVRLSLLAGIG